MCCLQYVVLNTGTRYRKTTRRVADECFSFGLTTRLLYWRIAVRRRQVGHSDEIRPNAVWSLFKEIFLRIQNYSSCRILRLCVIPTVFWGRRQRHYCVHRTPNGWQSYILKFVQTHLKFAHNIPYGHVDKIYYVFHVVDHVRIIRSEFAYKFQNVCRQRSQKLCKNSTRL